MAREVTDQYREIRRAWADLKLTKEQREVIRAYAVKHGSGWRMPLSRGWETGNFGFDGTDEEINALVDLRYLPDAWSQIDNAVIDYH